MDLLERETVLQDLAGHLTAATSGPGRVALVRGEAGIGKTTVIEHLIKLADPHVRALVGACDPLTTPRPLGPLLDLAPDCAETVRTALGQALAGAGHPGEVFQSLLDDLRGCPSLLVIEDVHWADEATLDLLRYLARRLPTVPALVVATYRDDAIGRAHPLAALLGTLAGYRWVSRHALARLSRLAVARLASGRAVDAEELYRVSAGNPFLVTEILAAPTEHIPATVREAVAGRLASLSEPARQVADMLAVLGHRASLPLLAGLLPDADGALEEATACGILRVGGQLIEFCHELARLAVLETVPVAYRLQIHRQVLAALRSGPVAADDLALVADHAEAAGDSAAVLEYAPQAAAHAAALGAYREAAAQYTRALHYAACLPPEQQASLLEGHAQACSMARRLDEAIASRRTAAKLRHALGDRLREGENLRWLSCMLHLNGHSTEAAQTGLEAVRTLEKLRPSAELGGAYLNLSTLAVYGHEDAEVAAAYADRAMAVGEQFGDAGLVVQARFLPAAARTLCGGSGWEECEHAVSSAMAQDLQLDASFLAMLMCLYAVQLHDDARATAAVQRSETYCLEHELLTYLYCTKAMDSWRLLHRGSWNQATDAAHGILSHPLSPPVDRAIALTVLGLVRARRGEPQVWPPLEQAARLVDANFLLSTGLGWEARVEVAWLTEDDELAKTEAHHGLSAVADRTHPWLSGALACWIRRTGGTPPQVPAAEPYALELAGDWAGAAARWDQLGCRYDAALARLAGNAAALRQALADLETLGARRAAKRARAMMRNRGVRPVRSSPRAATRANPYGLTNREMDVLKLLAEDLRDAEIAARLYITPKTAGHHVGAVLAKLGVHTRHEAARKFECPKSR
ncbi:ATP-binding protein [Streptomyces collinus]|uniref:LuxR family transcriptional regulator n=1 Tax=Streptomyces collinus (strain DSM 40733 / Tue 365) TaxID=1214242 RepID=S5UMA2_STRC3|nr:LuxR family transcriptional regulator [Streptomyces collinus]AGS66906.1 LuxR family transcriptional regulator [Streptomyces collinus Tu 365]AGS73788.1 LuxR family transcriptional regulator [Streptomyces collinus Tu 365]